MIAAMPSGKEAGRDATLILRGGRVELSFNELQASGLLGKVAEAPADAALAHLLESPPGPRFGPDRAGWDEDQGLVRQLGTELADALLGDPALRLFRRLLAERPPARLRIASEEPQLLGLPWELLTLGTGDSARALAQQCEILRVPLDGKADRDAGTASRALADGSELRIAIVSPRPGGPGDVPIQPALGPALATALVSPERIRLRVVRPPTLASLERDIASHGPFDVIHFDGHGWEGASGGTELVFEDRAGDPNPVDADAFAAVVAGAEPRLILINACRSASLGAGSTPVPSFAASLCRQLPSVRVIAMRYAVNADFVEALASSLYPLLAEGTAVGEAIMTTNARLARAWRQRQSTAVPLFVNLTAWAGPSFDDREVRVASHSEAFPVEWRHAAPALFWANEIEALHSALDADRRILVASVIGSATTEVVRQFAEYGTATGAFERTIAGLDGGAVSAPDGTLHVVTVGPEGEREAVLDACDELIRDRPRSAAIAIVTDGRPLPNALHPGGDVVPQDLIATQMRPLLGDRNPLATDADSAREWSLLLACQDDFAALRSLAACGSFEQAIGLLERLQWGNDLDGFELADPLRRALASLSEDQAKLVSLIGLSGGGLVYREMLSLVTTDGIEDTSFIDALGRRVEAEEWDDALRAAAAAGLFRLIEGAAPSPTALVTSHQALGLRERLMAWAGGDGVARLQGAFARCAIAFISGFDEAFRGSAGVYDTFLSAGDVLLMRALELGLRTRDDPLAARALSQLFVRPVDDPVATLRACEALADIHPVDSLPEFRASMLAWRAQDTVNRERWSEGLAQAEAALAVDGVRWVHMPKAYVQIMRSRALWRTSRTKDAEAVLAEAARSAGPAEEGAVASAYSDFAQYLHLNAEETERLRVRIGVPREMPSPLREAIAAEADGRYGDAFALWLANLRKCQTQDRSAAAAAFALEELGRFCAVYGSHEDAMYWLRNRLERGARLGLDPEQPLRYLGLSAERAGHFAEARSWLGDALAAARASGNERAEAECLYELALVAIQLDGDGMGAGRKELLAALAIFERTGPPLHAGDCWMMLAQVERGANDHAAAWSAADRMNASFRANKADAERLANAQLVIAALEGRDE